MATPEDLGPSLVAHVIERLQVDHDWRLDHSDGDVSWWPWLLKQRLRSLPPETVDGDTTTRVRIESDVLRNVPVENRTEALISAFNSQATFGSLIWRAEFGTVSLCSAVNTYEHIDYWIRDVAAIAAQMHLFEAHSIGADLAAMIGGEADVTEHPSSGRRTERDEMVGFVPAVVLPAGEGPPAFDITDFTDLGDHLDGLGAFSVEGPTPHGYTAEIPFTSSTPALVLRLSGQLHSETALFVAMPERHPRYGTGVLMTLQLPIDLGDQVHIVANGLNRYLADQGTARTPAHLGAWTGVDPNQMLTYTSFVPSLYRRRSLLRSLGIYVASQARLARTVLNSTPIHRSSP